MSEALGSRPARSRYMPALVLCLILCVLAGAILLTSFHLRRAMRHQIIQQDGITLYVSSFVQDSLLEGLPPELMADPDLRFADLSNRMFETAARRKALAMRVFDAKGELQMAWPNPAASRELSDREKMVIGGDRPLSLYEPAAESTDLEIEGIAGPVLRVLVPLAADETPLGAAEFILDGQNVAASLKEMNSDLWTYSAVIFLVGGGLISASVIVAYRRLEKTNQLLAQRTQSLLRANHELTLAAKTSAVGAIAAHLIHDLKNPLFGLQSFVRARGSADEEDWDIAVNTAERMQKMIGEIVRILQEEKTNESYELSLEELLDVVRNKLSAEAGKAGIDLVTETGYAASLVNRDANIIALVITNLVHNAIQAVTKGGRITVRAERAEGGAVFLVSDTGPGLPTHVQQTLFTPCRSRKAGGTGLGLAISKQLSNHLGGELSLKETSENGTTFELRVPERVFALELSR
jgi:signal transduction histidine kinase